MEISPTECPFGGMPEMAFKYIPMNTFQWISSQWIHFNEYTPMNTVQWLHSNDYSVMITPQWLEADRRIERQSPLEQAIKIRVIMHYLSRILE